MRRSLVFSMIVSSLGLVWVAGCTEPPAIDPAVVIKVRDQFIGDITEVPQGVRDLRTAATQAPLETAVVTGVVGGMSNPFEAGTETAFPWVAGQAAFFLVDNAVAEEFKKHFEDNPDHECAYCARKARQNADGVALVQFTVEKGEVLPYYAAPLLGLKVGQRVTIRGSANLLGNVLMIDAKALDIDPAPQPAQPVQSAAVVPATGQAAR